MKKYLIETYGCQMNTAESNAIELMLIGRGMVSTEAPNEADAVILNTCSVRKTAENRIWGRLGFYSAIKKKRPIKLIVTGCMADRMKDDMKKECPFIDLVVSNNEKAKIPEYLLEDSFEKEAQYKFVQSYYKEGEFSSYIPIMNGCNNFCSYCIVPYVRGREVSRDVQEIIDEMKALDERGVREVTLLGQNVNSYSSEYNGEHVDFPKLLELVTPYMKNILWVRFESPHPKDFSDDLIRVIKENKKVAKHIHLPMQSGNTRILQLMNRHTTREKFIALVEKMKAEIPELTLATDVIVGFPSETEEEYQETMSMMEIMNCSEAFMYYFNPREGTRAAEMDGQIDEKTKISRLEKLIDEQINRQKKNKEKQVPFDTTVIVTGTSRDDKDRYLGRNEHNEYFSLKSEKTLKPGDVVRVHATELSGNTFRGDEIV
ncbi:MAG: tRNA (N6-isopentenyl adenosine(37)-C2)-methylthiotransferase MiaB [Spirochaetales bacterium]|nr:tRNA (N6-isopentenyl adenosine(37)-C2)-methylthiotransferase MiaB [Candidatus Physcosoma equi]